MKEIQLTQGQVALVDDEDFERVNAFKWRAIWQTGRQSYCAMSHTGPRNARKGLIMSRFIMNTPDDLVVDHINHNTLDNRKENLRNCTRSQNQMNRRLHKNNTTGYKGITLNRNGYLVRVAVNRKRFCKWFSTLTEAITARDESLKKYHSEFACIK